MRFRDTNNYLKIGSTKEAEFSFFDDTDLAARKKAYDLARDCSARLDVNQVPPALVGVCVYRRLDEHPDLLEVGECRRGLKILPGDVAPN